MEELPPDNQIITNFIQQALDLTLNTRLDFKIEDFIVSANKLFRDYLKSQLKFDFLYSVLYFKDVYGKIRFPDTFYSDNESIINSMLDFRNKSKVAGNKIYLSTEIVLNSPQVEGLCIFWKNPEDTLNSETNVNLLMVDAYNEDDKSLKIKFPELTSNTRNIERLKGNFKLWREYDFNIAGNCQYNYLLKSSLNSKYQNGLISFASKSQLVDKQIREIQKIALIIFYRPTLDYIENLQQRSKEYTIKSAKAAIMARNISHNLGSHVMYYLNLKLDSVNSIIKEDVLKELLYNGTNIECKYFENLNGVRCKLQSIDNEKLSLPFLVGLGRFINYLQERMDFIATISTDFIPYCMTVNFKDSIYDELNYDLKIERHNDNVAEFKDKKVENILLDYIARSEGLNRENIEIHYRNFNGKEKFHNDLNNLRKVNVDLPGGEVGRQAMFSIFENIIRNAAKHSGSSLKETDNKLIYTIDTDEETYPDLIEVSVSDNIIHSEDLCHEGGKIFKALTEDYVDDKGELNEAGKGIKEMRISAAWLRGVFDEKVANPPVLMPSINKDKNLVFSFYLLKPQHLAIVSERFKSIFISENICDEVGFSFSFEKVNENLKRHGCGLYSPEEFKLSKSRHRLILIDKAIKGDSLSQLRLYCHSRIVTCDLDKIKEFKEVVTVNDTFLISYEDFLLKLYKEHTEDILKVSGNKLERIGIDDDKVLIKYPKENKNSSESFNLPYGLKYGTDGKRIKQSNIYITHGDINADFNIIFKKHFLSTDTKSIDKALASGKNNKIQFIESISGHNSTDRLIRNGIFDENWYYQMNESSLTRVALFDERLWADVSGISNDNIEKYFSFEIPFEIKQNIVNKINDLRDIESYKNKSFSEKVESIHKIICEEKQIEYGLINAQIGRYLHDDNLEKMLLNIAVFFKEKGVNKLSCDEDNSLSLKKKFITVFNVINCSDERFAIVKSDFNADSAFEDIFSCKTQEIGWIEKNNNGHIIIKAKFEEKFHFISIHQGILDKVYEKFGIKSDSDKMIKLTSEFRKEFCFKMFDKYINQLVIHSGRSHPSKEDMPQSIPFIQFSAIKNALKDCKFSLTEVFYAARFTNKR